MDELEDDVGLEDEAPHGLEDDVAEEPSALPKRKAALLVRASRSDCRDQSHVR